MKNNTLVRLPFLFLFFVLLLISNSCRSPQTETVVVDFSDVLPEVEMSDSSHSRASIRVAIATVISPRESFIYYKDLFDYMAEQLGLDVEFKQRMTYEEVNSLLAQNQVDIAFICSGAYVVASDSVELLAVPLHNGLPYYQGYVITRQDSDIRRFEDFRGRSFTYSDPLCFTGKLFIDGKLADMGTHADAFFGSILYSNSHDISIQMVSRGLVDGASVNGLIFDYLSAFQPSHVENIRVIEKSGYFGIPPIVNAKGMPDTLKADIQSFLQELHLNEKGRGILNHLQVDKFILSGDTLYDGVREARKRLMQ
ncbi:MAG: PhnD/SsuA/transferrin family substrate-binding protein [Bacteroides sp.]|jgi:phosphonate transport system substrate-binding protein|nr:PhnD/SsuA/transferrin family substrate-binding protein [Bacteroides sp.]